MGGKHCSSLAVLHAGPLRKLPHWQEQAGWNVNMTRLLELLLFLSNLADAFGEAVDWAAMFLRAAQCSCVDKC